MVILPSFLRNVDFSPLASAPPRLNPAPCGPVSLRSAARVKACWEPASRTKIRAIYLRHWLVCSRRRADVQRVCAEWKYLPSHLLVSHISA